MDTTTVIDREAQLASDIREAYEKNGAGFAEFRLAIRAADRRAKRRWLEGKGLTVAELSKAAAAIGLSAAYFFEA